jgi:hypothetical protein
MLTDLLHLDAEAVTGATCVLVVFVVGFSIGHSHALWRYITERSRWSRFFAASGWLDVAHCVGCSCSHRPVDAGKTNPGREAAGV